MKAFSRAVDRFCARRPNFGIRRLMLFIIIGTAAVYLFSVMDTTGTFMYYLFFDLDLILRGQIWRLFSFVFIPLDSRPLFLLLSLYFYYFIGSSLEDYWGKAKFTVYYVSGVLFTVLYAVAVRLITGSDIYLTATYINLSLFFAFAVLFPDVRVLLFFIIPIKVKWLALANAAFFVLVVVLSPFPINLLPIIAVVNFALFFFDTLIGLIKRARSVNSRTATNFRTSVHAAKREEASREYRHKCAVCGKTDADYPGLEFRYCSRCAGYHCFCEEHINSHIHFTE